jgi:hypothetical protein
MKTPQHAYVIQEAKAPVKVVTQSWRRGPRTHETPAVEATVSLGGMVWTTDVPSNESEANQANDWAHYLVNLVNGLSPKLPTVEEQPAEEPKAEGLFVQKVVTKEVSG